MTKKKPTWTLELLSAVILIGALFLILFAAPGFGSTPGPNYRNVTVVTTVNITNSYPEILSVVLPSSVTLTAGQTVSVTANVTVRDYDGYNDINLVNATFYDASVANATAPSDRNYHYKNTSCVQTGGTGFTANYSCTFSVYYYANNGSVWTANATAKDQGDFTDFESGTATIEPLLAINVTDEIDFGNMAVGDVSTTGIEANVTNFGNVLINVSVYGYGSTTGDGLAMVCTQRNITIGYEKFSVNNSTPYVSMTALATAAQNIPGLQMYQRTNDTAGGEVYNITYWRLQVPVSLNPAGTCNGSVVFQAESP
ncbi:hypothetical protein ACFL1B_02335 [Nanoarchaeota archaeon]